MNNGKSGYIALSSILIISAITLTVVTSLVGINLSEANAAYSFSQGKEVSTAAEACAEEAMLRLRNDATYTSGTLTMESITCTITVTGTAPSFTINVSASENIPPVYQKKLQITVKRRNNAINLITWSEIE
jgi:hypothetical protein